VAGIAAFHFAINWTLLKMNGQPANAIKMWKKKSVELRAEQKPKPTSNIGSNGIESNRMVSNRLESNETNRNQTELNPKPPSQINARKWHQTTWVWHGVWCVHGVYTLNEEIFLGPTDLGHHQIPCRNLR